MRARPALLGSSLVVLAIFLLAGCASTKPVNLSEPRRLVATDNDVRLDVQLFTENLSMSQRIPITYDITNNRATAIGVADLVPQTSYDPDTQTVTVSIGSEVPGEELLPRVVVVPSGQKKSFSSMAAIQLNMPMMGTPMMRFPNGVRVKLNFLGDVKPFAKLASLQEKAIHDRDLAAELFPKWVEGNETLYTNILPMRWSNGAVEDAPAAPPPRRRRP